MSSEESEKLAKAVAAHAKALDVKRLTITPEEERAEEAAEAIERRARD